MNKKKPWDYDPDFLTDEEREEHVVNIKNSLNDVKKLSDVMIILHDIMSELYEGSMDDGELSRKQAFEGFRGWSDMIIDRIAHHATKK